MGNGITVRDIDPGDKSRLRREARQTGVPMFALPPRIRKMIQDMKILYAGKAERPLLEMTVPEPETDPLFAPALVWRSLTEYRVTRHHRRLADEGALPSKQVYGVANLRPPADSPSGRPVVVPPDLDAGEVVMPRTAESGPRLPTAISSAMATGSTGRRRPFIRPAAW